MSLKTGYDSRNVMGKRAMLKNGRIARMFPRLSLGGLDPAEAALKEARGVRSNVEEELKKRGQ